MGERGCFRSGTVTRLGGGAGGDGACAPPVLKLTRGSPLAVTPMQADWKRRFSSARDWLWWFGYGRMIDCTGLDWVT